MVDLIVYEQQESKCLIVVNLRIIVHRTVYKRGQRIKISNIENNLDNFNSPLNIKNYITNYILIVNHIELNNDVETSNNIKSIFISNEGYNSNKKDIILPIDHDNNNVIVFKLIPRNSFIIRMYNHDWYKIVSQAMIDSLLRQYNYDSIIMRQNSTYSSTVCAVMSQCPSFFEVGSIQALKDANEIQMYEWG
jgi:hypothetical protein